MKNLTIRKYQTTDYSQWNAFVAAAKNATFLFHRDFMEYHSNRFDDFSLIIELDGKWLALLPANRIGTTVFSHQGLTYGGLLISEKVKSATQLQIFQELLKYLHKLEMTTLKIKSLPTIYAKYFSDELNYLLFLVHAQLTRRDALAVIDLRMPLSLSKDRKEGIKRGEKNQLEVREEHDFELFWNTILIPNLEQKHQAKPVHSLEEIRFLKTKFPLNIRQFNVYYQNTIVAGTTIFETDTVAHSQYISGNEMKNDLGSLDFLHNHLLTKVFHQKKYFDFGISNENEGRNVNQGLSYWKESFGSHTVTQDFYEVDTKNYTLLNSVLI